MPDATVNRGRRNLITIIAAAVTLACLSLAAVNGCASSNTASPLPASPGIRHITVGLVPAEGATGVDIAQQEGLFARAGLDVTIRTVASSVDVIPDLVHGSVQVVSGQYQPYIAADVAGVAPMTIIAPGFALAAHVNEIMTGPHSPVRSLAALEGKTIAVNVVNSEVSDLLYTTLAAAGITPAQVHVVAIPFPAMPAALAAHHVDAIYETEPYVTEAGQKYGDTELADVDSGPAVNFPVAGYAVLSSFAKKDPRTVTAFARAVEDANGIADSNIGELQKAFITALHLPATVADTMATGDFPTRTDPGQLQRVADLMQRYGQLSKPFRVRVMVGQ